MKKTGLLVLAMIIFYSCSKELSPKETAKKNIEKYIINKINDPSSYEFVEISNLDTIAEKEYYNFLRLSNDKTEQQLYDILYKDSNEKIIVTKFTMRGKNAFGAKMIKSMDVILSDSLKVKDIIDK
jgi:PBP1b-binding outer membrane lipoprotein LpoB